MSAPPRRQLDAPAVGFITPWRRGRRVPPPSLGQHLHRSSLIRRHVHRRQPCGPLASGHITRYIQAITASNTVSSLQILRQQWHECDEREQHIVESHSTSPLRTVCDRATRTGGPSECHESKSQCSTASCGSLLKRACQPLTGSPPGAPFPEHSSGPTSWEEETLQCDTRWTTAPTTIRRISATRPLP